MADGGKRVSDAEARAALLEPGRGEEQADDLGALGVGGGGADLGEQAREREVLNPGAARPSRGCDREALQWPAILPGPGQGRGMSNALSSALTVRCLPIRSVMSTSPCLPNADSAFPYRVASTECSDVSWRAYA